MTDKELKKMLAELAAETEESRNPAPMEDLTYNYDGRGDWAYFIEARHFSKNQWLVDDEARTRMMEPVFFRVLYNGEQGHSHGWLEDNRVVQWG